MAADPKWVRDLDAMRGRKMHLEIVESAWLSYLLARLPKRERARVVKMIRASRTPAEYVEQGGPPGEWT